MFPLLSCGSDFEFGLGSFSLLEEITSGQEWAKFLTPNLASASADQRTLQEVKVPPFSTRSLIPNHSSNNQRGFLDSVASPFPDVGATHTWPGDLQPVSMDVSEEEQCGRRATEQMESMEHGAAPADMRIGRQRRPLSFSQVAHQVVLSQSFHSLVNLSLLIRFHMQPADVENNSWMKSRVQMNRKRHHHLTERVEKDVQHPDTGQGQLSGHKRSSGLVDVCKSSVLFLIPQKASGLP